MWVLTWQMPRHIPRTMHNLWAHVRNCMAWAGRAGRAPVRLRAQLRQAARHDGLGSRHALCRTECCLLYGRQRMFGGGSPRCSLVRRSVMTM